MTSLAERLRGILPTARPREAAVDDVPQTSSSAAREAAAETLGGEWQDGFLVVDRHYSPGYRHGHVAVADAAPSEDGWARLNLLGGGGTHYLFLDLETTGLAGGAGTYAFLVGLGWFEGCRFRVRQFFLASYAAERVLLQAVRDLATQSGTVVTYNGKSFDLPVLETRYVMNRMETPFAQLAHVDMLHPARRLWRASTGSDPDESVFRGGRSRPEPSESGCRLIALEQSLCGHRREGDVPGFEIPARYFHYVRTGDARQLEAVLEHNRLDLLSLALVTAHAAQLLDTGAAAAQRAREALGLGQLYERAGMAVEARAAFQRASTLPADAATRAEALRALAIICRRMRDYHDAAVAWQTILELRGTPMSIAREASEALAVHHEHRLRDPRSARSFAVRSLHLPITAARREAIEHRLARLDRKLGQRDLPGAVPLF